MDLINPSQRRMRRSERITGKYQQAIQAATAAVQGLAGGNLSAALAGGAAPYIAEIIKQTPGWCGACGSSCSSECSPVSGTG
nr:hypothetical protein [Escherichia coli]